VREHFRRVVERKFAGARAKQRSHGAPAALARGRRLSLGDADMLVPPARLCRSLVRKETPAAAPTRV